LWLTLALTSRREGRARAKTKEEPIEIYRKTFREKSLWEKSKNNNKTEKQTQTTKSKANPKHQEKTDAKK